MFSPADRIVVSVKRLFEIPKNKKQDMADDPLSRTSKKFFIDYHKRVRAFMNIPVIMTQYMSE